LAETGHIQIAEGAIGLPVMLFISFHFISGNAANVPLLHELQHGAPRRKQVRILGTDAGDKGTLKQEVLLVAQGARGTLPAQALRPGDVVVTQGNDGEPLATQPKLDDF